MTSATVAAMDLRISLAGHMRIEVDGTVVQGAGLGSLGRLTLAYLVVERGRPVRTDELARVLWDDEPPTTWRIAVRGLVSKLRAVLGEAGLARDQVLDSGQGWYQLCLPAGAVVDVEEAASRLRLAGEALEDARRGIAGQATAARRAAGVVLEISAQPFLVGGSGSWVEQRQRELVELRVQALEATAEALTLAGDPASAVVRAEEAIMVDPLRETAHVRLMAALAAGGNRGAALRAYERCRRLLVEELGVGPSSQTEVAYLDLLGSEAVETETAASNRPRQEPGAGESAPLALPVPLTSFVGRQGELAEVRRLLEATRFLTITGLAGVGKSRLALQAARRQADEGAEVVLVDLASVGEPARVSERVAESLGLREACGGDVVERLVAHVSPRSLLLVLDNCEHLVQACAELVHTLLSAGAALRVLATSQVRMQVAGETVWTLAPLHVPVTETGQVEDLLDTEAVALFLARARHVRPDLVVTDGDTGALIRLCRRLDGLPLALELAAAHARLLSIQEIASGLDSRLDLLSSPNRTAAPRHQTLRAALDWSHERLATSQGQLLARLSVFAGGFTLESAREVAAGDNLDGPGLYGELAALVDASLVQADPRPRTARYTMLQTVRHYASERLEASGEAPELHERHLAWATSVAEQAAPRLEGDDQRTWLDHLEAEYANLVAAMSRATPARSALPLAAALGRYWEIRGHLSEGREWLSRFLDDPEQSPELAPVRARALGAAAGLAQRQGDDGAARSWLEEGLALHRHAGDLAGEAASLHGLGLLDARAGDVSSARSRYLNSLAIGRQLAAVGVVATALANLGWLAQGQGDLAAARTLLQESLRLFSEEGATYGMAWSQYFLGRLSEAQGDLDGARAYYEQSQVRRRQLGDRAGLADVADALGSVSLHQGDLAGARSSHEESLALCRELGDRTGMLASLRHLGDVARLGGAAEDARRHYRESLGIASDLGDSCCVTRACLALAKVARGDGCGGEARALLAQAVALGTPAPAGILLAEWMEGVAAVATDEGLDHQSEAMLVSAARLWGAAGALRGALGIPVSRGEQAGYDVDRARGSRALGERGWVVACGEGAATDLEAAVEQALRHLSRRAGD